MASPRRRRLLQVASAGALLGVALIGLASGYPRWRGPAPGQPDASLTPMDQARRAIDLHDPQTARDALTRWLALHPSDAGAHFLLARAGRLCRDEVAWQAHLNMARKLGWPNELLALEEELGRDRWHGSRAIHQALLRHLGSPLPDDVAVLEVLLVDDLDNDLLDEAVRLATGWMRRHPDDWRPPFYRAAARVRLPMPRWGEAVVDLRRALDLNPAAFEARLRLAQAYASSGRRQEALDEYRACVAQRPDSIAALLGVADCQLSLSHVEEARATLAQVLARDKDCAEAQVLLARADWVDGEPERSLDCLNRAALRSPGDRHVLAERLTALRQLDRTAEAERCLERLRAVRQKETELDGLVAEARRQPDLPDLRYRAGTLTLELGRSEEALHWFHAALWIDPNHRPTYRALAAYWADHDRPDLAAVYRGRGQERH